MEKKELSSSKRALLEKWLKEGQSKVESLPIPKRPSNSKLFLSFPQQRQLFLEVLDRGTPVNNLSVMIRIKGDLDVKALESSANKIIERHESLRTYFSFENGLPELKIKNQISLEIQLNDLRYHSIEARKKEARRMAEKVALTPFSLSTPPLIQLILYRLEEEEFYLQVLIHHSIADGWSLGVFLKELMAYYLEIRKGQKANLPVLPIQYADYSYWQNQSEQQQSFQTSLNYWKNQLKGDLPVLEIPTDVPRGSKMSFSGGTYRFDLNRNHLSALETICKKEDSSLFIGLLTVFKIMLHRYSGQEEILVGTPIANRNIPEIQPLIGVFINTLVLRTFLEKDLSFLELLRKVRKVSLEAYSHQDLPFEKLVQELKPLRDLSRPPLFQVVFNFQNSPLPELELPGLEIGFVDIDSGVSQFDMSLIISKNEGNYNAKIEYNKALFRPESIERMFQSFELLLENSVSDPELPLSQLCYFPKSEAKRLNKLFDTTQVNFPNRKCFHQLFEEQVEKTPEAIAVIFEQKKFTYQEVNQSANSLAWKLRELGIGVEVPVGVWMNRSWTMLIAFLAIHKAGGYYIPIHTSFPEHRVKFILNDASIKILLTNLEKEKYEGLDVSVLNLKENHNEYFEGNKSNLSSESNSGNLAYIIYTSGSTGTPKGVMINQYSLVNFLCSMTKEPGIKKSDVLLAVTSTSFDISALELFLPLIKGACVVIANDEMLQDPIKIARGIRENEITLMQSTPAMWQLLIDCGWEGEKRLKALCGGDKLSRKLADQLLDRTTEVWNMYGPTETTIWSAFKKLKDGELLVTINQAVDNTKMIILDHYGQEVPTNVEGDLLIGGLGLSRGYVNLFDLEKEKFINLSNGKRYFNTGDRARYLNDGSIEILGRKDDQVKIQSNRVEMGEISSALIEHPSIQDAVILARTEKLDTKKLVAYYILENDNALSSAELRVFLSKKLPGYMIPSFFIPLKRMPLTPNGKINKSALPLPQTNNEFSDYMAPRNMEEQILCDIWKNVLNLEQVGINDNFFDLGGASMQSLQIVAKANMLGIPITVAQIFEHQTIAELVSNS